GEPRLVRPKHTWPAGKHARGMARVGNEHARGTALSRSIGPGLAHAHSTHRTRSRAHVRERENIAQAVLPNAARQAGWRALARARRTCSGRGERPASPRGIAAGRIKGVRTEPPQGNRQGPDALDSDRPAQARV